MMKRIISYCLFSVLISPVFADPELPDVQQFNQSMKLGAKLIALNDDDGWGFRLEEGSIPPNIEGDWDDRSALATTLFPIAPSKPYSLTFKHQSDPSLGADVSYLWIEVRHFDASGVYLGSSNGDLLESTAEWQTHEVNFTVENPDVRFAELMWVKHHDEVSQSLIDEAIAALQEDEKPASESNEEVENSAVDKGRNNIDAEEKRKAILAVYTPQVLAEIGSPILLSDFRLH